MILYAHRGDSRHFTENTRLAFDSSIKKGFCAVEMDLVRLKDNVVVIFHDRTLKRLFGKGKSVSKLNYVEFKQLFPDLLSFNEFTDIYQNQKIHCNLEIKDDPLTFDLVRDQIGALSSVVISSFNHEVVHHAIQNGFAGAYLVENFVGFKLAHKDFLSKRIHLSGKMVLDSKDPEQHYGTYDVYCYTINDAAEAKQLAGLKFVKGFFTDDEELLKIFPQNHALFAAT